MDAICTEKNIDLLLMECEHRSFKITIINPHPEDNLDSEKECEILMRWSDRDHCWWSMVVIGYDKSQTWKINAIANKLSELCVSRSYRYITEFIESGILSFELRRI